MTFQKKHLLLIMAGICHPGKILKEEFLTPSGLNTSQLAKDINISSKEIRDIISEKKDLTKDIATRLALYFNTAPAFWINLQSNYNEEKVEKTLYKSLKKEIEPLSNHFHHHLNLKSKSPLKKHLLK